jgi:predicted O-methyltransferase YrrM
MKAPFTPKLSAATYYPITYSIMRTEAIAAGLSARPMLDHLQLGFLADLACGAPDGDALEIGAYFGSSSVCCGLMRRGRGAFHVVDPFNQKAKQRAVFDSVMARHGLEPVVHVGSSHDPGIVERWPKELAFAFIDGDHSLSGVTVDIQNVVHRIVPHGIVVFHDYTENCQGVMAAVDLWRGSASWALIGQVSSAIAFMRPGK